MGDCASLGKGGKRSLPHPWCPHQHGETQPVPLRMTALHQVGHLQFAISRQTKPKHTISSQPHNIYLTLAILSDQITIPTSPSPVCFHLPSSPSHSPSHSFIPIFSQHCLCSAIFHQQLSADCTILLTHSTREIHSLVTSRFCSDRWKRRDRQIPLRFPYLPRAVKTHICLHQHPLFA